MRLGVVRAGVGGWGGRLGSRSDGLIIQLSCFAYLLVPDSTTAWSRLRLSFMCYLQEQCNASNVGSNSHIDINVGVVLRCLKNL